VSHFAFRRHSRAKARVANSATDKESTMKRKDDKVHGEGNYKAAKEFDAAEAAFVKSGRVDKAARDAAPKSPAEEAELARAEQLARGGAREEDPALRRRAPAKGRP
jgi:hypothetical protein